MPRLLLLALLLAPAAWADVDPGDWKTVDLKALPTLDAVTRQLAERRVVFVGENHEDYAHHLSQLAIIRRLHALRPDLTVGVEFFQQPFQAVLDKFVAGEIGEEELLRRSEYFDRWRYDWRLYRPIFQFLREKRIPAIALNVPAELTRKVADGGIAGLSSEEKSHLPELDRSDLAYRERLREVFEQHPGAEKKNFENFYEAQLLWDEGMAERAASYLNENPGRPMVILAGAGHLQHGDGIPERLARRIDSSGAIVLNGQVAELGPKTADYVVLPPQARLPAQGRLGIAMEPVEGAVTVGDLDDKSPAQAAGIKKGDRLVRVNGHEVRDVADVRLALIEARPGDTVEVAVSRRQLLGGEEARQYRVVLR